MTKQEERERAIAEAAYERCGVAYAASPRVVANIIAAVNRTHPPDPLDVGALEAAARVCDELADQPGWDATWSRALGHAATRIRSLVVAVEPVRQTWQEAVRSSGLTEEQQARLLAVQAEDPRAMEAEPREEALRALVGPARDEMDALRAEVDRLRAQLAAETARAQEAEAARRSDIGATARSFRERDIAVERAERAEKACALFFDASRAVVNTSGNGDEEETRCYDALADLVEAGGAPASLAEKYDADLLAVAKATLENTMAAYPGSVSGHEVIEWRGRVDLARTVELAIARPR